MVRRQPRSRSICPNNPGPKKMGRTYLSKIPTISSNPHTIMLLLIVGEFGYPEVTAVGLLTLWTRPAHPARPVCTRHAVQASTISYCPARAVWLYDIHGGTSSTSPTRHILVPHWPGTGARAIHRHLTSHGLPC